MCTDREQRQMQKEMRAYDALPRCIQKVFDEAPRKTSVHNVMGLRGMKNYRAEHGDEKFAVVLKAHLAQQAQEETHASI